MAKVTQQLQLLGKEFLASTISSFSAELDAELEAWIFPNPQSNLRLFGAILKEQHQD